jgi:hypothetical protein
MRHQQVFQWSGGEVVQVGILSSEQVVQQGQRGNRIATDALTHLDGRRRLRLGQ